MERRTKTMDDSLLRLETASGTFLAASVFSSKALAKMLIKTGANHIEQPMVCVSNRIDLLDIVAEFPETAYLLSTRFWPGSLNLIFSSGENVPGILNNRSSTVMVTMPQNDEFRQFIDLHGPLAVVKDSCEESEFLGSEDGEVFKTDSGIINDDATVISFLDSHSPLIVSPGSIPVEKIKEVTGTIEWFTGGSVQNYFDKQSPSLVLSTPLFVAEKDSLSVYDQSSCNRVALVTFGESVNFSSEYEFVRNLSLAGDLGEAAANLYPTLQDLDCRGYDAIFLELLPSQHPLGSLLNRRLREIGLDISKFGLLMNEAY
ncbi:Sua5/YciO/YrdC/YwlC family protein [Chitinispirillales bacterium ANBcel5]|uniref:Sua5/YciO/YrdC/YwlC family protein n=1 Tax=Cellulosispirillum alkaliphilum TaxID=3039283 RepID=UPI002A573D42|nr:Sua5/YciO/YrdC/YwlC family protein [Chitinispirillales bacterium ANBcel5]